MSKTIVAGIECLVLIVCFSLIYAYPLIGILPLIILFTILVKASGIAKKDSQQGKSTIKKMAAAIYSIGDYKMKQQVIPIYSSRQVLIEVYSAAINPIDYKINTAALPFYRYWTNNNIGRDVCGKIIEVGKDVTGYQIGDFVYGFANQGSLAEYVTASPSIIAKKPEGLTCSEASSLPLVGTTGILALKRNGIKENDELLVVGASGGTGSIGVQLGKYYGAKVTGISSSKNVDFVQSLGASKVIPYDSSNFQEQLDQLKFDLIYDTVTSPDDENYEVKTRKLLKDNKTYVAINAGPVDWLRSLLSKRALNMNLQRSNYDLVIPEKGYKMNVDLQVLTDAVDKNFVKPLIDSEYNFTYDGVNAAFTKLKNRRAKGKIVINIKKE